MGTRHHRRSGGDPVSAEDYGWPGAMLLALADGMPTRPRRAMSALDTLCATLNDGPTIPPRPRRHAHPRHAMGGRWARTLNAVGLGRTAKPRRAR